jgi:hypothetical protein
MPRKELHRRAIELRGYAREDGLYDVEAHLVDTKTYDWHRDEGGTLPAGAPVHEMWIRLTVDQDLLVHDVIACTDAAPHATCPEAASALSRLKGLRIAGGWNRKVKELLGGAQGCTHLAELLGPVATTAFQTLAPVRLARPEVRNGGAPVKINSCYAYASTGELVRRRWPEFYTRPEEPKRS